MGRQFRSTAAGKTPPAASWREFFTAGASPGGILGADRTEDPVTEDERIQLLGSVSEAHSAIREKFLVA